MLFAHTSHILDYDDDMSEGDVRVRP